MLTEYRNYIIDNIAIIPQGVKCIDRDAYSMCTSLTSIIIPDGVTFIGERAFYGCTNLISIELPDSLQFIDDEAFEGCTSLISINLPSYLKYIGERAFFLCSNLIDINIPDSVTTIGEGAFWDCPIKSINIPEKLSSIINGFSFRSMYLLEEISVSPNNLYYSDSGNCLLSKGGEILIAGCNSSVIPNSVTSIGQYAFRSCLFKELNLPNSIKTIGAGAFHLCSNLSSIIIPNSVISIDEGAFEHCRSLTNIVIPNSVMKIDSSSFRGCSSLESIIVSPLNRQYSSDGDCLLTKDGQELILGCKKSIIPKSVTTIRDGAFTNCTRLSTLTIPDSVSKIGQDAFWNCGTLREITIPCSIQIIGKNAFSLCSAIEKLNLYYSDPAIPEALLHTAGIQDFSKIVLNIPIGSGYAYRRNSFFSQFKAIIPIL